MVFVELALIVIGALGILFGRLIQAALSRQRELLADASAVQFMRNPAGLAGALKKIGSAGSKIESAHAGEASHMFFENDLGKPLFGMMATHRRWSNAFAPLIRTGTASSPRSALPLAWNDAGRQAEQGNRPGTLPGLKPRWRPDGLRRGRFAGGTAVGVPFSTEPAVQGKAEQVPRGTGARCRRGALRVAGGLRREPAAEPACRVKAARFPALQTSLPVEKREPSLTPPVTRRRALGSQVRPQLSGLATPAESQTPM